MITIILTDITHLTPQDYDILYAQASPERQQKADRYLRQEDKLRCVVADALIRHAVKEALDLPHFQVEPDANGKPHLKDVEGFHYNLSHAGSYVAIAYGPTPVGLDIEQYRFDADTDALARRFYTPDEQICLRLLLPDQRKERFFQIWTAKESILKYWGTGLRRSLDSFSTLTIEKDTGIVLHHRKLEGHSLTLATKDPHCTIQSLDLHFHSQLRNTANDHRR